MKPAIYVIIMCTMFLSVSMAQDPNKKGEFVQLFHYNKKLKAEGVLLKTASGSSVNIGKWKFYNEKGILVKELDYWNGQSFSSPIKYGEIKDTSKYYSEEGKLQLVLLQQTAKDASPRLDTLFEYYPDGKLYKKYDESQKLYMVNARINTRIMFEFSGRYEEYYPNGNIKQTGFLLKFPRRRITKEDISKEYYKNILQAGQKRIGFWYFFSKEGELSDVKEYRLNGNLKKSIEKNELEKIISEYKKKKKKFKFNDEIRVDE